MNLYSKLNAKYDPDLSLDYGVHVFIKDKFIVEQDFLMELIQTKSLKGVDIKNLPKEFEATVIIKMMLSKSEILIFSNSLTIPSICYEEQFLNINLINRAQDNNGLLGFKIELSNKSKLIDINYSLLD